MQHGKSTAENIQPQGLAPWRMLIVLVLWSAVPGCVTPWEKYALMKDKHPDIERVQGPAERRMRNLFGARQKETASEDNTLKPLAGTEEYLAATELYNDEDYAAAQKAFKTVAKKYKKSEIREDALFMQAEAAFQQEHYSRAHDAYAVLLQEYPSSRHLDVVTERLFKIGRIWLGFPEVARLNEIQQVNLEDPAHKLPAEEPPEPNKTPVYIPNFTNQQRPLFDTAGNGVAALQAIWMNDPTGPLADDAMMLVASHHARQGNYIEADRYFRMLRETFPNSPHLKDAFLIGSHVKLMSYQGADYDGKTLNDAQMLKESTLRLYPNIGESERLKEELARIEAAKAEREWAEVELWLRKGNKRAASVKCHQLISLYPGSPRAEKAMAALEEMGPEYVSGAVLLTPVDPPKPPLWRTALGMKSPTTPAGRRPAPTTDAEPYADEQTQEQSPSGWLPKPFRKRSVPADSMEETSEEAELESEDSDADVNEVETPRKRNWFWPAPRKLPEEGDADARKLEVNESSGRARL